MREAKDETGRMHEGAGRRTMNRMRRMGRTMSRRMMLTRVRGGHRPREGRVAIPTPVATPLPLPASPFAHPPIGARTTRTSWVALRGALGALLGARGP
eukprot:4734528-Pyramimonas_sp.AAC.1